MHQLQAATAAATPAATPTAILAITRKMHSMNPCDPDQMVGDVLHSCDSGVAAFTGGAIFDGLLQLAVPALGIQPTRNTVVLQRRMAWSSESA